MGNHLDSTRGQTPPIPAKNTKQRILGAALEEFSQLGLAGARVDRIAEKAGVNKAMIYYHYSSKENLYRQVVESFFIEASENLWDTVTGSESIEELLSRLVEFYTDLFSRRPAFTPIFLRELADAKGELLDRVANILVGSGAPMQAMRLFSEGSREEHLRSVNARHALILFLTMNIGYFVAAPIIDRVWNIVDRDAFIRERNKVVVDIFLNGIRARQT